ncbi:MAG: hypothetical protein Q4D38_13860, partial [Planctomycetia bacterium]|nr:hypothetical protein [Planctomycetia bacterium]
MKKMAFLFGINSYSPPLWPFKYARQDAELELLSKLEALSTQHAELFKEYQETLIDYSENSPQAQSVVGRIISNGASYFGEREKLQKLYESQIQAMRAEGAREEGAKFQAVRKKLDTLLQRCRETGITQPPTTVEQVCRLIPMLPDSLAGDRLVKTINGVEYAWRWCP